MVMVMDGGRAGGGRRRKRKRGRGGGRGKKVPIIIIIIFILKWYDEVIHSPSHLVLPIRLIYRRRGEGHFCSLFKTRKTRLRAVE